jgi:hypothetical protein
LPFAPRVLDSTIVSIVSIGISLLATLYPSSAATRILPAEALRYEKSRAHRHQSNGKLAAAGLYQFRNWCRPNTHCKVALSSRKQRLSML